MDKLIIKSRADDPTLAKAASVVEQAAWIRLAFLNFTRSHYAYYEELLDYYAEYQLCLVNEESGYVVAAANCVPFYCEEPDDLPDEGWDWIVETAYRTRNRPANMLGGLAVSVPPAYQASGLARVMIRAMKDLANAKGLMGPVIPVRPSLKSKHPHVPMSDYIAWRDEQGRIYDPWMRSHAAMGGSILKPCERSMVVEEPVGFWEAWTNRRFSESGDYEIDGGLTPLKIDLGRGIGCYAEPNVWFVYS